MLKSRQSLKEQFCQGCTVSDEILKLIYFMFKTDCELHGFFVNPMCLFCYNCHYGNGFRQTKEDE